MQIHKDQIFARFDAGDRVGGIGDDAGTQFLGMARVIAAEQMNTGRYRYCIEAVKPEELFAEYMTDGNALVLWKPTKFTEPSQVPLSAAGKIIAGWPKWKQKICMLQARYANRRRIEP